MTPPRWGEETIRTLPRGRHLIAVNAGHNVTPYGCAPALIAEFLEHGTADGLDGSCLDDLSRPPFVTSLSGPEP